jgi:lipoate-protein ligase B
MGARDYVCRMQKTLERYLAEAHGIKSASSIHTGVFLDDTTKIGSIGVQVRHRLTSHGFALNITQEPLAWFDRIVACGLEGVKAGSVESVKGAKIRVEDEIPALAQKFGDLYEREVVPIIVEEVGEIGEAIWRLEEEAARADQWLREPKAYETH